LDKSSFKVTCKTCHRYEIVTQLPTIDDWRCSLCSAREDGVKRPLRQLTTCGTCNQVYDSKEDCPNCGFEPKTKEYRMGKLGDWGKEPKVNENVRDAVEKGETILRKRVREKIEQNEERQINIEKLLIEQNKILKSLLKIEKRERHR
jgi:hypothetical protein